MFTFIENYWMFLVLTIPPLLFGNPGSSPYAGGSSMYFPIQPKIRIE